MRPSGDGCRRSRSLTMARPTTSGRCSADDVPTAAPSGRFVASGGGNDRVMKNRIACAAVLAAAVSGGGCSSKTRESIATDLQTAATDVSNGAESVTNDVAEALGRNIATQQGEEQFKNSGHELDGPLTCQATVQDSAREDQHQMHRHN